VAAAYDRISAHPLAGRWEVVAVDSGGDLRTPEVIAADVAERVLARL
jgi:hypothetical protein